MFKGVFTKMNTGVFKGVQGVFTIYGVHSGFPAATLESSSCIVSVILSKFVKSVQIYCSKRYRDFSLNEKL